MDHRFFTILDGASLTNEDSAGATKYYGFTRPGGSWVIMKYDSSAGTYKFALGKDLNRSLTTYDIAWTNRATIGYTRPGNLKRL